MRFEMDRLVAHDDESLKGEFRRVAGLVSEQVLAYRGFEEHSRVSSSTVRRRFGGWKESLDAAGLSDRYGGRQVSQKMKGQGGRALSSSEVILELRRVAAVLGQPTLSPDELAEHSPLAGARVVRSRFGSWRAGLEAAGLEVTPYQRRWTGDDYFENLLGVWTHYGRAPKYAEMNRSPSRITNSGYAAKFGSWGLAKQAFVKRVNSDLDEGQREAASSPAATVKQPKPRQEDQRQIPIGLRYQIFRRDRFRCVICGRSPATNLDVALHVDHVLAFSRGGKTRLDNLRCCATTATSESVQAIDGPDRA